MSLHNMGANVLKAIKAGFMGLNAGLIYLRQFYLNIIKFKLAYIELHLKEMNKISLQYTQI